MVKVLSSYRQYEGGKPPLEDCNRPRIDQEDSLLLCCDWYVCMTAHQDVPSLQWGRSVMTVCQINHISTQLLKKETTVVRKDGEFQHHLVYFRVAISSYTNN
jgi:hypothetical protein